MRGHSQREVFGTRCDEQQVEWAALQAFGPAYEMAAVVVAMGAAAAVHASAVDDTDACWWGGG